MIPKPHTQSSRQTRVRTPQAGVSTHVGDRSQGSTTSLRLFAAASAIIIGLFILPACRSQDRATPPSWAAQARSLDQPPGDFSLDITIRTPQELAQSRDTPRYQRPLRFVIQPDLLLRASEGTGVRETTFPPIIRRLDHNQMALLWRQIVDSPLLDDDTLARTPQRTTSQIDLLIDPQTPPTVRSGVIGTASPEPTFVDAPTYTISISALGKRRTLRLTAADAAVDTLRTQQLVETLCDLAWIPPTSASARQTTP